MSDAGRRVLITGAGRGIGAATARLAAAKGWAVGVNYRADAASAQALVAEIRSGGGLAEAIQADIAERDAIGPMFDRAEAALGPLDAVVLNAGVIGPRGPLASFEPDRIARLMHVNATAQLWCAAEAARRLTREGRRGDRALLLVSSAASRLGSGGEYVDYAASKGAMDTAVLGLAKELGPAGLRVNGVRPGLIETEIHADAGWPARASALGAETPLGRAGRPEEVAAAILWLISEEASYVAGALLDVAGGR